MINTYTEGDQVYPQVVNISGSGFAVVWHGPPEVDDNGADYARVFDLSAQALGPEFILEDVFGKVPVSGSTDSFLAFGRHHQISRFGTDGSVQSEFVGPSVSNVDLDLTSTADDSIMLAWADDGVSIHAQRFSSDGQPSSSRIVIDDKRDEYPRPPRVVSGPDGSITVVWWAEFADTLWIRQYDSADMPLGDRFPVASGDLLGGAGLSDVCTDQSTGDSVVVWHDEENILLFRRFGKMGENLSPVLSSDLGSIPSLACATGGEFVVAGFFSSIHMEQLYLGLRQFDSENRPLGTILIPVPHRPQPKLRVASLSNHTVVAVWSECEDQSSSGCDIFAQQFALDPRPDCEGDCNGDGTVSIDELIRTVGLGLSEQCDLEICAAIQTDTDCAVSVSELVDAVNNAMGNGSNGCERPEAFVKPNLVKTLDTR